MTRLLDFIRVELLFVAWRAQRWATRRLRPTPRWMRTRR